MTINRDQLFNAREFERALSASDRPLPLFRAALKSGRDVLEKQHTENTAAPQIVAAQAWLIDQLLIAAWVLHLPLLPSEKALSLIAVGGYGRGELHPASDIDLMLLTEKEQHEQIGGFAETLIQFL